MDCVLKYPGAKNRLAPWIVQYIPKHKVYLEPFAGSLAVLFHKPRCHIETVNDINEEVTNFFHILRDFPEELERLLKCTPYSRMEYQRAFELTDDPMEKARRFCIRCWMGIASANLNKNGFRNGQRENAPNPAKAWAYLPDTAMEAAKRLRGVQIENLPALELISRYNSADVFIYADPPYLRETRTQKLYKYEMSAEDHVALLEELLSHPGKVLLSGYDNMLYNDMLCEWNKVRCQTRADHGSQRIETLWMNYDAGFQQLSFLDQGNEKCITQAVK